MVVPQVSASPAHQHYGEGIVIARAERALEFLRRTRRRSRRPEHRGENLFNDHCGLAPAIEMRVVFDDFEREQRMVGGKIAQRRDEAGRGYAAGDGRAHAGRIARLDRVQIDRDSVAGGAGARDADRVVEHRVDAALLDLRHGEDLHAELGEESGLLGLIAADAYEAQVLGRERPFGASGELRIRAVPEQRGERHSVPHAAGAGRRRVAIHVGVDPDQPQRTAGGQRLGRAAPGSDRAAVVAAEHDRKFPCADDRAHLARQARAEIDDHIIPGFAAAKLRLQRDAPEHIGALSGKVRQQSIGKQLMRTLAAARIAGAQP